MGWYYTCPFCKDIGKYAYMNCNCQNVEDARIIALMKGSTIVDVTKDPMFDCTYTHLLKDGVHHYIRYSPAREGGIAGFRVITELEFESGCLGGCLDAISLDTPLECDTSLSQHSEKK